jgi:hypothetical protein
MNERQGNASEYGPYEGGLHPWTSKSLQAHEVLEFLDWLLAKDSIAETRVIDQNTGKKALVGKYECLQGRWIYRGSDFTGRIWVGFQALRQAGYSPKDAHITLAELPAVRKRLGRSRQGQRSHRRIPSLDRRRETIRSLVDRFSSPFKDWLLEMRVGQYRHFQMHRDASAELKSLVERNRCSSQGIIQYSAEEIGRLALLTEISGLK